MSDRFIVAEVSKNWELGNNDEENSLLSQRFEQVINTNLQRGYDLVEWKTHVFVQDKVVNETIIAIFEFKTTKP